MGMEFEIEDFTPWDEMTDEQKEAEYRYWEQQPESVYYAIANVPATIEEIRGAARILRVVKTQLDAMGLHEWESTSPDMLLDLFERRAAKEAGKDWKPH